MCIRDSAYTVIVNRASSSAQKKIKQSGGEVTLPVKKTDKKAEVSTEEEKTEDVENNNG